jgi:hypothetical protein
MSWTEPTTYTAAINAALKGSGPVKALIDRLGSSFGWPANAPQAGVVSVPVFSAYTAAATTAGTMTTSGTNNTIASMTLTNATVTDKRLPNDWYGILSSEESTRTMIAQMADALQADAIYTMIDALIAASPTTSNTLTAGKAHFAAATATELAIVTKTVHEVAAYNSGSLDGLIGVMPAVEWANFTTAVATLLGGAYSRLDAGGMFNYIIPWVPIADVSTTVWGAVSNSAAFILHPRGYGLKQTEAFSHYPGIPWPAGDGTHEITFHAPHCQGALNVNLIGEIKNDAS